MWQVSVRGAKQVKIEDLGNGAYKARYIVPPDFKEDEIQVR